MRVICVTKIIDFDPDHTSGVTRNAPIYNRELNTAKYKIPATDYKILHFISSLIYNIDSKIFTQNITTNRTNRKYSITITQ